MKVVHCKVDPYDVYIGRPSIWGNPFSHKPDTSAKFKTNTVEEAVSNYEDWIKTQPQLLEKLGDLKGKVLACWCKTKSNPNKPCHGDVLLRLANE